MRKLMPCAALWLTVLGFVAACTGPEERLAQYMERGTQYYSERNYDKARVEFSNALQIDPKNAEARYMSGQIAERQNNPRDAVGHYQAAIDADANHLKARAALGRLFLFGGLADRALELVEPGLATAPNDVQLLTVRGAARAQLRNVEGAFEDAQAALAAGPDDEYAIALLASLYSQNARSDRAIEIVRAGLERIPRNVDLRVILADLELRQGNPAAAEEQLDRIVELEPDNVAHWQRLARFHLLQKNPEAAERAIRASVDKDPGNLEAKLGLVDFLAAQRGTEVAEQQMLEFVRADAGNQELKLALGRFYEGRQTDKAESTYRDVAQNAGTRPAGLTARTRLAALLVQKNEVTEAEEFIAQVLTENPRDNDALILRANIALSRNDATAAITDLRSVLRDQPTAIPVMRALARAHAQNNELALAEETLRAASEANPQDAATRLDLAQLLVRSNRADQARPILEKLVMDAPNDIQAQEALFRVQAAQRDMAAARSTAEDVLRVRPDLALGHYLVGLIDETEQKNAAALASYERALAVQPDGAEPLAAYVRLQVRTGQTERALARLDEIAKQFPNNMIARNLKGELLMARGDYRAAIAAFDEAIAKNPQWWIPYRSLALAHLGAKNTDAAIQALSAGVEKTGGAAALTTDLATLYERVGRSDDAIQLYERMVAANPGSFAAANNLAMLLVSYRTDRPSLDRAAQLAEQLSGRTEPSFVNTRGWVRYKRGEYQEALPLLRQAVEQLPDSPVMRYHLGMAQLKLGDKTGARQNLEQALEANQAFAGIEEARSALKEAST